MEIMLEIRGAATITRLKRKQLVLDYYRHTVPEAIQEVEHDCHNMHREAHQQPQSALEGLHERVQGAAGDFLENTHRTLMDGFISYAIYHSVCKY